METKTDDSDVIQIPGYSTFLKNRTKLVKIRSGGIGLLVKDALLKYITAVHTNCEYVLWFKISYLLFNSDEDVYCGILYISPKSSKYSSPDCYLEVEQELHDITKDSKHVCLLGDFNSRVGNLRDFVITDDFFSKQSKL